MFPAAVLLLEFYGTSGRMQRWALLKHIVLNPMVLSTLLGAVWSITGVGDSGPRCRLPENLCRRADTMRAVCNRVWTLARRHASQSRLIIGASGGQNDHHAYDCLRGGGGFGGCPPPPHAGGGCFPGPTPQKDLFFPRGRKKERGGGG